MPIKRHRRQLARGEEKLYTYQVSGDGTQRSSLSIRDSSVSPPVYRSKEKKRIVAALLANSSLLVVSEPGAGKSFLAQAVKEELEAQNFLVAAPSIGTVKQVLLDIANALGVDVETLEGKTMNTQQLQSAIRERICRRQHALFLDQQIAFLVLDDAHRFPVSLRCWLEQLHTQGQPMLLLATYPPARDIFLKLPRIQLEPLSDHEVAGFA